MIDLVKFSSGAAVGGLGVASAEGFSIPVSGKVLAVHLAFQDAPPVTAQIKVSDENDPSGEGILELNGVNTDVKHYPRRDVQDAGGVDRTYNGTQVVGDKYVVHGRLKVELSDVNEGDSVDVSVWIEG